MMEIVQVGIEKTLWKTYYN